ncbi:unnamed protein product [Cylicostephanus goldi]|uniref:Uncharacterized protein n=1 Tax=Cylicostephanus goldi TaxID=71465 RepID=A0A3P6PZ27_CYLGO|nr:unnamed protein product [Cylicostephanus goldi]
MIEPLNFYQFRICQFISCSAENFKKDPTFGNIQLAAQFFINPEAITAVCKEQGMDEGQCKLFSNGFQLIDRFITTIESRSSSKIEPPKTEAPKIPERMENDIMMDDAEYIMDLPQPRKVYGSKTWSSQPEQTGGPHLLDVRNDLVASFTPLPPAPPLLPPTPPPAPPLAFPTVPSLIVPPIVASILPVDKLFKLKPDPIIRRQHDTDWDFLDDDDDDKQRRVKRGDYYDDVHGSKSGSANSESHPTQTGSSSGPSDDYYGAITDAAPKPPVESTPLQNCVHILGIY